MKKLLLNLRLFDEGAAGAAGAAEAGADAGAQADVQKPATGKRALRDVHYGKAPVEEAEPEAPEGSEAAGREPDTHVETDTQVERSAAFEELIKGEYKNQFNERVQQIINARFKDNKQLETKLAALSPVLDILGSKYGVDASDVDALGKAIQEDDSYFEEEAAKEGLTVEQLKHFRQMERELAEVRQAREQQSHREEFDRRFSGWMNEGEQLSKVYPGFDFRGEVFHPETGERFMDLLRSGVDVKTAYEVIHKDELLGGAIQHAVQATQRKTMDSIRARGMRPSENGGRGNAPAKVVKSDPSQWTKADREEVARRVLRGEKIEL